MRKARRSVTIFFMSYCLISSCGFANQDERVEEKKRSVVETKKEKIFEAAINPFSIALNRPTYILPFYYTGSPDNAVYQGSLPNGEKIKNIEFKGQISLLMPLIPKFFNNNHNLSLNIAYTQLSYWQSYNRSKYFRETDYEPEVFIENHPQKNIVMRVGLDHQSNGRGTHLERSWNRGVGSIQLSGSNWLVGLKVWAIIFKKQSSDLYNPDIGHYLGNENILFSYKLNKTVFSLQLQNIESGLKRGFVEASVSHPIMERVLLYAQYFNGYGQSLIEYNHRTQSAGLGIAFNNWI